MFVCFGVISLLDKSTYNYFENLDILIKSIKKFRKEILN